MRTDKYVVTQTKSHLKMVFACWLSTFNDKLQLVPIFINAMKAQIGSSWSNTVMTPIHQQRRKPPSLTYLFYTAEKRNVHLRAGGTGIRGALSAPMLPSPTPSTVCSILRIGIIIINNVQVPRIVLQKYETPHVMAGALWSDILLNGVKRRKTNKRN